MPETPQDALPDDMNPPAPSDERRPVRIGKVTLDCESCGKVTSHRVLHLDRAGRISREYSGVARCAVCQSTHPFRLAEPRERTVVVRVVVSDGSRSLVERVPLAAGLTLEEGGRIDLAAGRASIRRIDLRSGRGRGPIRAEGLTTIWAIRDSALRVPVSIIEGARTRGIQTLAAPDTEFEVGGTLSFEGAVYRIHAIRSKGRNYDGAGLRFRGTEIARVYVHAESEEVPRMSRSRSFFPRTGGGRGPRTVGPGPRRAGIRRASRYPRRSARMPPAGNRD